MQIHEIFKKKSPEGRTVCKFTIVYNKVTNK